MKELAVNGGMTDRSASEEFRRFLAWSRSPYPSTQGAVRVWPIHRGPTCRECWACAKKGKL